MRSKVLVLLLICFCINLAVADRWAIHLHRRDGPPATTSSTTGSPAASQTGGGDNGGKTGGDTTAGNATVTANSTSSAVPAHTDSSITAITSNINGPAPTSSLSFSGFNCKFRTRL